MPAGTRAFAFVQLEFGFELGPPDGRYLTRPARASDAERVIVLRTLGAPERRRLSGRRPKAVTDVEAEPVPTTRATLIHADGLDGADAARARLALLRRDAGEREDEVERALAELNRVLRAYRAAAADPRVRGVARRQAIAVRVGWGSGEQVADGRFSEAFAVPAPRVRERRVARLEPQERLAAILGGRDDVLACEELVLRARTDLDERRPREAALQARVALEAALAELPAAGGLAAHRETVGQAANAALAGDPSPALQQAVAAAVEELERALRRLGGREPGA